MQIIRITPRGFGSNTYVLTEDGKRAVVIDPAQPRVAGELEKLGLTAEYVLLTHCHFDHVAGVPALQNKGAKVYCSAQEAPLIGTDADLFPLFGAPRTPYTVDGTLCDGEERDFCGISVQTLLTPGHTAGGACYLATEKDGGRYLFTGDTLFEGTVGRTDFPTGNVALLRSSLRRLSALEGEMPVYPGHEEETTLETERKTNPFMLDI
ncbi:MAG: MBL fold metallo-hydrolase [Clostridia bacterium]|nr:MBL fold metallo-hydrolase [Clostridia bacterium]MBQ9729166.1 MBL fold metallo-hydrolase [Clostridia bacterium]